MAPAARNRLTNTASATAVPDGTAPCSESLIDCNAAVTAARRAFDEGPWPRLKAAERASVLRAIAAGIRTHAEEFIAREVADIGMPVAQMKGLAILKSAD